MSLVLFRYLRIFLTAVQCSLPGLLWYLPTKLTARFTSGLVHSMAYIMDPMAEALGMTHLLFILCRGRALSRAQFHTLQYRQEPFLGLIHFELVQNLIKVCALRKTYEAS